MMDTFLGSPIPMGYANRMAAGDFSTEVGERCCWQCMPGMSCLLDR